MKYLISNERFSVAHIWIGEDTACKMYSTGGMKKSGKFVVEANEVRSVCKICQNSLNKKPKTDEYRIYLDVPYLERYEAKDAGARWDAAAKAWYIIDSDDARLFLKWRRKNT